MDEPVRGESVSEEGGGVSTKRKESSGSLWHRSHLHSLAGSRWTDDRIDGQTECVGGWVGGAQILAGTAAPPPAATGRTGMPEDE